MLVCIEKAFRSLLHSQEERIAALETGEEASVTRIKRLKSKLDARDDEIDRLRCSCHVYLDPMQMPSQS